MVNSASKPENGALLQEKVLFSWQAYERPFDKKGKEFYLNAGAILAVICLVIFIAEGWVPVALLLSLAFLYYILNTVEPRKIEYSLTNKGIRIKDKLIDWGSIASFWIEKKRDFSLLILGVNFPPGKLSLVINKEDGEKIKSLAKNYALEQEIPPSTAERLLGWFSTKLQKQKSE